MLFEPIELELDKKRPFKLNLRALMRAETEINRLRGAKVNERMAIDHLILSAARNSVMNNGGFPMDLFFALVWAGLVECDPEVKQDDIAEIVEASPRRRSQIMSEIWEYYLRVTTKPDPDQPPTKEQETDSDPLAKRPGSTGGLLQ
jgi:hypothetical protein